VKIARVTIHGWRICLECGWAFHRKRFRAHRLAARSRPILERELFGRDDPAGVGDGENGMLCLVARPGAGRRLR
jgi:hypothetical protein